MNRMHDRTLRAASPSTSRLKHKLLPLSLSLLGIAAASLWPCGEAVAAGPAAGTLPTGGSIVSGVASVNTTGTTLTVTQSSAQLAMNWSSFDIAQGSTVSFMQPSANAIALNRIGIGSSSPTASQIFGNLSANGQLFLVNPAGIVFGSTASLNVGGLVASTLDMDPTTLAGGAQSFHLDASSLTGSVVNHGTITAATGGGVVLIGGGVNSDGMIVANGGHIFLDGADHATLDFDGNNLINVTLTGALSNGSGTAVSNAGTLESDGGMVVLQASATPGLFTQMVNNTGIVEANGVSNINGGVGGTVQLIGSGGAVANANTISANGATGAAAGNVAISSDQAVAAGGTIATTGLSGGGISLNGGSLALSGAVNAGASAVTLTSGAGIAQSGGSVVTAALLTGESIGGTTLSNSNMIQSVDNFTSHGGFTLNNGSALQVGTLSASNGAVALTTSGTGSDLTFTGNVSAQSLSLNSGGAVSQSGGVLTANSLSGSSVEGTTLGQANLINSLTGFSAKGFTLVNAGALDVTGSLSGTGNGNVSLTTTSGGLSIDGVVSGGANVSLTGAGSLTVNADVAASSTLNLVGSSITQTSGSITAPLLTGQSTSVTTLNSMGNSIFQLNSFSAGGFSLTNGGALTVAGPVISTGNISLSTSAGDLNVLGMVSGSNVGLTSGNNLALMSAVTARGTLDLQGQSITQTAGTLTANQLIGSSTGSASMAQYNAISSLGAFTSSGLSLANTGTLNVMGVVSSSGGISLTSKNGSLLLSGSLSGGLVALNASNGLVAQTGGGLSATTLAVSSQGDTTLTGGSNSITNLGNFRIGGALDLKNNGAIAQNGTLYVGGDTTLDATGNTITLGNGNQLTGAVSLAGGTSVINNAMPLNLGASTVSGNLSAITTGGAITQSGALSVSGTSSFNAAGGAITLGGSNQLQGAVSLAGGDTLINNVGPLIFGASTVTGALSASTGNASITQIGPLTVTGSSTFHAGTGAITLTGNNQMQGAVSLVGGNAAINNAAALTLGSSDILGSLAATTDNADISQSSGTSLNVSGASMFNAGSGSIALDNANNSLGMSVGLYGANVSATNLGSLNISSLGIGANGSLSLISTHGSLSLPSGSINTGSGDLVLKAGGGSLALPGNLAGGNVTLSSLNDLVLSSAVTATHTVSLTSSGGAISQNGNGLITADTLTGGSFGGTSLGLANQVAQLGGFSASSFAMGNGQTLTVTGPLSSAGDVGLTISHGDLKLNGAMDGANSTLMVQNGNLAVNGAVSVTNLSLSALAGTITEGAGGNIAVTGSLTGSSSGSTSLDQANNLAVLGSFTAGGFSLTNGQSLVTTGTLNSTGGAALAVTRGNLQLNGLIQASDLTLKAVGDISEGASSAISANSLGGQSGGNATFTQAGNSIGSIANFSSGGDFSLSNDAAIVQSGTSTLAVQGTTALNAGNHAITLGNANQLQGAVSLIGGNTAINNARALTLGASNVSGNLVASTSSTGAAINQSAPLSVTGTSTFTADTAAGTGAISLADADNTFGSSVSVTGTGIALRSNGDLHLGVVSDGANGAVSLVSGGTLYLPSAVIDTGTSDLTLSALGGSLVTGGALRGAHVALAGAQGIALANDISATQSLSLVASGGAISQTAGVLSTPVLTGSSQGATTLTGVNRVGQLAGFTANGFSLANTGALLVGGPLDSVGRVALSTSGGDLTLQGAVNGTDVSLVASGGAVKQSGGALVANSLSGSSTGASALNQRGNAIGSLGNYSSGGDFSLVDASALTVSGVLSSAGYLAMSVGGDLVLANAVSGQTVVLDAAAGSITQTGGTLTAGTLAGDSGGSTTLAQANQVGNLGSYRSGGDFSFTNGMAITQSSSLQVQGATTLNAGTNAITLTHRANGLIGAVSITGGDTEIVNEGPLVFGASQINGNLSATSTDPAIGQVGALHVTGSSYFNAGNDSIVLTDAGNQLTGPVTAIGTGIAITNAGDLHIASLTNGANGAVSLMSLGGTLYLPVSAIATGNADLLLMSGNGMLTTAGDLGGANIALMGGGGISLGHAVTATNNLSLVSSQGSISQGAGTVAAASLTGSSSGATSLTGANRVGSIGSFNANGFSLTNAGGLSVGGPLLSTGNVLLVTQAGDLDITGTVSGTAVTLKAAGAINEGPAGNIVATTLSGSAGGVTALGTKGQPVTNHIGTLGGFQSPAGFSLTNGQTLTLASVGGSSYTVDAGTSPLYLAVLDGSLLQLGTTPLYDSVGTFAASEHIGLSSAPIYAFGTLPYVVDVIGLPPAYFYALDRQGNPLPEAGSSSTNLSSTSSIGSAVIGYNRQDAYIDASQVTGGSVGYGVVPTGIRLPPGLEACDPRRAAECRNE
ncbi:filamentous hemagglutinin N-terminal domain-containing protein [Dyella telluris]|uniref:Filamentous hemagglutinin N-terminal domain-containing protein n=1 Tax=Dyella telluris TaxID=2763498 RepID=A0A7G8Q3U8_9GAMM|nr:filamentous hemagglutinin N-terminal domain-containing protein [Dyella telluris]QNK01456.1 filamentous hemagglutinin N-terminal domain-containing protein [Dyella telluris]